ncbi:MAG: lysylphosphatidylglycerol synthase transmembrane domain-containing protein [Chloroflexota bacterium]
MPHKVDAGGRRLIVGLARWALGFAIVGFLLLRFDFRAIAGAVQHADLRIAALALFGLVAVHLLGAVAWHQLSIRLADVRLPWWPTITHYYAAQAVGSVTPANLGADAYRLAAVRTAEGGWGTLLLPIVVQRVTSYVALSVVSLAALVLLPSSFSTRLLVLSGVGLTVVSFAVLVLVRRPHLAAGLLRRLPQRMRPGPRGPALPTRKWTAALTSGIGLGLAFHMGSIGMVYLLVLALGGSGNAGPILASIAVARLSILIPLSPSGLGFQEAALSVLFLQIGLTAEMALATALLNRVALLGTMALGAAFVVSGQTGTLRATAKGLTQPTA